MWTAGGEAWRNPLAGGAENCWDKSCRKVWNLLQKKFWRTGETETTEQPPKGWAPVVLFGETTPSSLQSPCSAISGGELPAPCSLAAVSTLQERAGGNAEGCAHTTQSLGSNRAVSYKQHRGVGVATSPSATEPQEDIWLRRRDSKDTRMTRPSGTILRLSGARGLSWLSPWERGPLSRTVLLF